MSYHARRLSTVCASQRQHGMPRPTSFDRVCCPKAVMACHARCRSNMFVVHGLLWHAPPRHRSIVCIAQRRRWHATPDVVRPCVLYTGGDVMPRPMRAGHGRPLCAGTSDDGRPFVLSKGYDGMPRPTTADRLCCQRAKMACHARRRSTVCAAKRRRWHATPDAVRPCVLPKGDDGMHATPDVVRPCVLPKGDDGMPRPTSLDRVCCPKAMMACHARRRSTVCAAQRR